jgi:hypothetical protein
MKSGDFISNLMDLIRIRKVGKSDFKAYIDDAATPIDCKTMGTDLSTDIRILSERQFHGLLRNYD